MILGFPPDLIFRDCGVMNASEGQIKAHPQRRKKNKYFRGKRTMVLSDSSEK